MHAVQIWDHFERELIKLLNNEKMYIFLKHPDIILDFWSCCIQKFLQNSRLIFISWFSIRVANLKKKSVSFFCINRYINLILSVILDTIPNNWQSLSSSNELHNYQWVVRKKFETFSTGTRFPYSQHWNRTMIDYLFFSFHQYDY